jgi:galactoside 2-L-fucosyltransferase 1/2
MTTTSLMSLNVDRYPEHIGKHILELISLRYRHMYNSSGTVHAININHHTNGTIFHTNIGRLGNQLFQLAAITSIAKQNGMDTCIREGDNSELALFFDGVGDAPSCEAAQPWRHIIENGYATWQQYKLRQQDVLLEGFFQSYKYIDTEVRTKIHFKSIIQTHARSFIQTFPERVLVGIHVRRYESSHLKVPTQRYFENAMEHFTRRHMHVGFVVVSDDPDWCNEQPYFNENNVHIVRGRQHPVIDMAILAACDHIIISVGTFGWWAAYLGPDSRVGGTVVYYDSEFLDGSGQNTGLVQVADYYPPHWIAVGDKDKHDVIPV